MSALEFCPLKSFGRVVKVCSSCKVPLSGSREKAVTVECSSLSTKTYLPPGEKARWRGPAPGLTCAQGCSFGSNFPSRGSKRKIMILSVPKSHEYANRLVGLSTIQWACG